MVTPRGRWTNTLDLHFSTAVCKGLELNDAKSLRCQKGSHQGQNPDRNIQSTKAKFNNQHDMGK